VPEQFPPLGLFATMLFLTVPPTATMPPPTRALFPLMVLLLIVSALLKLRMPPPFQLFCRATAVRGLPGLEVCDKRCGQGKSSSRPTSPVHGNKTRF
jgi:hypothetical protein